MITSAIPASFSSNVHAKESTSAPLNRDCSRLNRLEDSSAPALGGTFPRLWSSRWQPLYLAGGFVAGVVLVRLALQFQLPLPFCLLREWTGIPCPGCGATRSLLGWSHLDPLEALRFNPLFFALTLALGVWIVAAVADGWLGTRWVDRLKAVWKRWTTTRLLILVLGANWLYLWLTLPK